MEAPRWVNATFTLRHPEARRLHQPHEGSLSKGPLSGRSLGPLVKTRAFGMTPSGRVNFRSPPDQLC